MNLLVSKDKEPRNKTKTQILEEKMKTRKIGKRSKRTNKMKKVMAVGLGALAISSMGIGAAVAADQQSNPLLEQTQELEEEKNGFFASFAKLFAQEEKIFNQVEMIYQDNQESYDAIEAKLDALYGKLSAAEKAGDYVTAETVWEEIDAVEDEYDKLDQDTGMEKQYEDLEELYDDDTWEDLEDYDEYEDDYESYEAWLAAEGIDVDDLQVQELISQLEAVDMQIDIAFENSDHLFWGLDEQMDEIFFQLLEMENPESNEKEVVALVQELQELDAQYIELEEQIAGDLFVQAEEIEEELFGDIDYDWEEYDDWGDDWEEEDYDDLDDEEFGDYEDDEKDEDDEEEDREESDELEDEDDE